MSIEAILVSPNMFAHIVLVTSPERCPFTGMRWTPDERAQATGIVVGIVCRAMRALCGNRR